MMGLGYLENGGSSSNLSASAPPFSVDRSNSKPNSNPLVNFSNPPYVVPYNSSLHSWQYSHSPDPAPNFFLNPDSEGDAMRTTSLPSANDYPYSVHQSINSTIPHWPPSDHVAESETDGVPYLQYSRDMSTNFFESKPYYSQYVAPIIDNDSPLVSLNEPSYDLLPTSHGVPLHGSSQIDYTQSLSGLEYAPKWGGFWNGLADGEQNKSLELDGGFRPEEMNVAGSSVYRNYMTQGAHIAQSLSNSEVDSNFAGAHIGAHIAESLNNSEIDSAKSHGKLINDSRRDNHLSSCAAGFDDKSFMGQSSRFIPIDSSRTSTLETISCHLVSQPQASSIDTAINPWDYQNSSWSSFQRADSYTSDYKSGTRASPASIIKPPVTGINYSSVNSGLQEHVSFFSDIGSGNSDGSNFNCTSKRKEPHLPLSSDGKEKCLVGDGLNLHLESYDSIFVPSPFTRKPDFFKNPVVKDALDDTFNARAGFQVSDIIAPDRSNMPVDIVKATSCSEQFSDSSDNHNPAVDSPCWKPASYFSSFEVPIAENTRHLMKTTSEAFNGSNVEGTRILPPCTGDSERASLQKIYENSVHLENGCAENDLSLSLSRCPDVTCTTKEHELNEAVAPGGLHGLKLSSTCGLQVTSDMRKSSTLYGLSHDSKCAADLKLYQPEQANEECNVKSKLNLKLQSGIAGLENRDDAPADGFMQLLASKSVPCVPPEEKTYNLAKLQAKEPAPKMNAQTLTNTMHNLSELLLYHCSTDACALSEQDRESLKLVINNLETCLSKNMIGVTPDQESSLPNQCISLKAGELFDHDEGVSAGRREVRKEASSSAHCPRDLNCAPEEKLNVSDIGKEDDNYWNFCREDADDVPRDDDMVKVIKKALAVNLHGEEDVQSLTLLYKNLWLEAEAELCSLSYRARFDRMKIDLDKSKSQNAKDVSKDSRAVEKVPSSGVPPDLNMIHKLARQSKDSEILDNTLQNSPKLSTTSHVDDVEASVMGRFQILKRRDDSSTSMSMGGQEHPEFIDAGSGNKGNNWPFVGNQSDAEASQILDTAVQNPPISSTTSPVDDVEASVMARFQILKCQGDNSTSTSMEGKEHPGVTDAGFGNKGNNWPFDGNQSEAEGSRFLDTTVQNSPISSTTSHVDDVEASVMARFRILKCRGENSISMSTEGEEHPEVIDAGFDKMGNNWPFVGNQLGAGNTGMPSGPPFQHYETIQNVDQFGSYVLGTRLGDLKEFRVCSGDDIAVQSSRYNRMASQLALGLNDSSSSDWEHVLKEEILWQN